MNYDTTELQRDMAWLDTEDLVERDIDRAVAYSKKADGNLWVAGMYAARVVGKYSGGTEEIHKRSGKSISSIQNWAHAYEMLVLVLKNSQLTGNWGFVRENWRVLSPTHFWTAWEKVNKYDLGIDAVCGYLYQMLNYRYNNESWSADALAREIDAHEDKSGNVPTWSYYKTRLSSLLKNAILAAPAEIKQAIAEVLRRLETE